MEQQPQQNQMQQSQPQQPQQQMPPQGGVQPEQKKSKTWLWVLGGCLGLIILTIIIIVALGWWGINKVKKEVGPEFEEFIEDAEEFQMEKEKIQKEAEEFQKKMESVPMPSEGSVN